MLLPRGWPLAFLLLFLLALAARAAPAERVLILKPLSGDPLLEEAVIRARGELSAMGLSVEVRGVDEAALSESSPVPPEFNGALVLTSDESTIWIRAYGARSAAPLTQPISKAGPDADAEIVAVRAVETLNAVLQDPTPLESRGSPPPSYEPPAVASRRARVAPSLPFAPSVWAGPSLSFVDTGAAVGAELGLFVRGSWASAGLSVDTTLLPARIDAREGRADIRRTVALVKLQGELPLGSATALIATLGAGLGHYDVTGVAESPERARKTQHQSFVVGAEIGVLRWLTRRFGAYAQFDTAVAQNAPVIRMLSREVATLDRPTFGFSTGLAFGSP